MSTNLKIIKRPILSEKSAVATEKYNRVAFEVDVNATKTQIREAVERFFKAKVQSVNTVIVPGKVYRTKASMNKSPSWKKALVTLKAGEKIEFFKGV